MNKQCFPALVITVIALNNLVIAEKTLASEFTDQLNLLSIDFNQRLAQGINGLNQNLGEVNISLFDTHSLYSNDFPNEFANHTDACVIGPLLAPSSAPTSICSNPEEFVYFDDVHPTSAANDRIADIANLALNSNSISGIDEVFIFGDSFSDRNNIFTVSGGIFPPPFAPDGPLKGQPLYSPGALTNDLLWWEHLISDLGVPTPAPFFGVSTPTTTTGGINFAFSGATTGRDNVNNAGSAPFPDLPGVKDQVDAFSSFFPTSGVQANPEALYIIYAGGNNFLGALIADPNHPLAPFPDFTLNPQQPVNDIVEHITTLHTLGARNFLVGNLFPLGNTPLARDFEELNNVVPEPSTILGSLLITGILWKKIRAKN